MLTTVLCPARTQGGQARFDAVRAVRHERCSDQRAGFSRRALRSVHAEAPQCGLLQLLALHAPLTKPAHLDGRRDHAFPHEQLTSEGFRPRHAIASPARAEGELVCWPPTEQRRRAPQERCAWQCGTLLDCLQVLLHEHGELLPRLRQQQPPGHTAFL